MSKITTTTKTPILVDIIFLDMDGVLLPFGDQDYQYANILGGGIRLAYTYADGCIFPNETMAALTSLLARLRGTRIEGIVEGEDGNNGGNGATMNPKIVLSSSWRSRPKFVRDILRSFRTYVASRRAGAGGKDEDDDVGTVMSEEAWASALDDDGNAFFDVTDTTYHSTRYDEIVNWVTNARRNGGDEFIIRSWIALDDEDLVNVEGRIMSDMTKHAVRTVSSVGLTPRDANVGIRLLDEQVREYYTMNESAQRGP
jgi:hypothetical protein